MSQERKCLSCRVRLAIRNDETCGHGSCRQHVAEAEKWAKDVCDRIFSHYPKDHPFRKSA